MNELLLRMFAASLRRDIDNTTFKELQQCLLNTLTRNIAGDGRVVTLAGDLVDLIDEHDTALSLLQIIVSLLKKSRKQTLHILAHITGLGKHCRIHDSERDVQHLGYRLGQQCLTCSCRTYEKNIGLLQFHAVIRFILQVMIYSLIVIIYSH